MPTNRPTAKPCPARAGAFSTVLALSALVPLVARCGPSGAPSPSGAGAAADGIPDPSLRDRQCLDLGDAASGPAPGQAYSGDGFELANDGAEAPALRPHAVPIAWRLQSSAVAAATGEEVSAPGYDDRGWFAARVPSTVFGTLVANGVYPDPTFGMNLCRAPGAGYPIGQNFSNLEMPEGSPFAVPYWYRGEFELPAAGPLGRVWLRFDGINYAASIFVNGQLVASSDVVRGAFRRFEFDITEKSLFGAKNALSVRVAAPEPTDLGLTFVDWNPMPPDKVMGLWNDVTLYQSGPISIRDPFVTTKLDVPTRGAASLTVGTTLTNGSNSEAQATLTATIDTVQLSEEVTLAPHETRRVTLQPTAHQELVIDNPRLWWPWQYGTPELYTVKLSVTTEGQVSDTVEERIGIREFTSELTDKGHRLFKINGKPILIRGAGYTSDMLLRRNRARDLAEIQYVRAMNLNAIRLEGKMGNEHLLELCDEMGVLVLAGFCCCDAWEKWDRWPSRQVDVASASLRDQIRALRNHPSMLVWMNSSDLPAPPEIEAEYLKTLDEEGWPRALTLSAAGSFSTPGLGASGVKMTGPYDWIPPSYWLTNTDRGGAFGFNTETSPGPAIPPVESLARFLPADHLWPIDPVWEYHAGGTVFSSVDRYAKALAARHGAPTGLDDFAQKSQLMAYEGIRAMFEAYGGRKYQTTGVIQWMLNNAWPSVIWHLYDYYLKPGGGFFGAQKANELLHAQYQYDSRDVLVVNSSLLPEPGVKLSADLFGMDSRLLWSGQATVDLGEDAVVRALTVPAVESQPRTQLLRLRWTRHGGEASSNVYWLSTKPDVMNFGASDWYYTPATSYADMTGLSELPQTTLVAAATTVSSESEETATITLENDSAAIAFFVRVEVVDAADGREVLPIRYSDNYVSVWPGERTRLEARYRSVDRKGGAVLLRLEGVNVKRAEIPVAP